MARATQTASKALKAISFSQLNDFETCPKQYYHKSIARDVKQAESPEMAYGKEVHKAMENLMMFGRPLPDNLKYLDDVMAPFVAKRDLQDVEILGESQLAITADMKPTGWFAKDVWLRAIVDLMILAGRRAVIVDYKTGRRPDTPDFTQLEICAAVAGIMYPSIERFDMMFLWTKSDVPDGKRKDLAHLRREDLPSVWNQLLPRNNRLQEAVAKSSFPPNPSGLCRGWCPVTTCQHWEQRRPRR